MAEVLREGFDAEIIADLDVGVYENFFDLLDIKDFVAVVVKLESDDALFVFEELDKGGQ